MAYATAEIQWRHAPTATLSQRERKSVTQSKICAATTTKRHPTPSKSASPDIFAQWMPHSGTDAKACRSLCHAKISRNMHTERYRLEQLTSLAHDRRPTPEKLQPQVPG